MKHLCCSRFLLLLSLCISFLYAQKSALIYLGKEISYPMAGVHDYIIVAPKNTSTYTHGFHLYNKKIYARVPVEAGFNPEVLLQKCRSLQQSGYQNIFLDIASATPIKPLERLFNKIAIDAQLQKLHLAMAAEDDATLEKLLLHVDTLVLYNASLQDNILEKTAHYAESISTIIDIENTNNTQTNMLEKLRNAGVITYQTNADMDIYGKTEIQVVKREILTIIDESVDDRIVSSAHQYGALPLEYYGYIQKLHDIRKGLPDVEHLSQYHGVVIWLSINYDNPDALISWVKQLIAHKIPVVFASEFGFNISGELISQLGIRTLDGKENAKKRVTFKDPMMDYEIQTPLNKETLYFQPPKGSRPLFVYTDDDGLSSTPAAITPWGGYAISESFFVELDDQNIWVINPFAFFKEALRLQEIPVPDTTTQNGNRLFFTHIDGDGIMNGVEFNPELVSGDVIYSEILSKYKVPHSVSIIGAEVMPNGLYPKLSPRLIKIAQNMYALPNVEPATHTFTHPFFWGKIHNDTLDAQYRLKPKGYDFSLSYEINGSLAFIQTKLLPPKSTKKAQSVFWSGDCAPRVDALEYVYKNRVLNINGGDTTINNAQPWLTLIAPLGIQRGQYYQIYTGAQNENVFTNDWLGPFWGFKKVVQTFQLTNKPKRLKPIDIYYHLYSGSKKASLNALRYVFDWVLKQKYILPLYTSEYIPKAMDYFDISIAKDSNSNWIVDGLNDLKTLRFKQTNNSQMFLSSKSVIALTKENNSLYVGVNQDSRHFIPNTQNTNTLKTKAYIVHANAQLSEYIHTAHSQRFVFKPHVALDVLLHLPTSCQLTSKDKILTQQVDTQLLHVKSLTPQEKVIIDVQCK